MAPFHSVLIFWRNLNVNDQIFIIIIANFDGTFCFILVAIMLQFKQLRMLGVMAASLTAPRQLRHHKKN